MPHERPSGLAPHLDLRMAGRRPGQRRSYQGCAGQAAGALPDQGGPLQALQSARGSLWAAARLQGLPAQPGRSVRGAGLAVRPPPVPLLCLSGKAAGWAAARAGARLHQQVSRRREGEHTLQPLARPRRAAGLHRQQAVAASQGNKAGCVLRRAGPLLACLPPIIAPACSRAASLVQAGCPCWSHDPGPRAPVGVEPPP